MNKIDSNPLYIQVEQELLNSMRENGYNSTKLMSEEDLAEELGVSRATIREAMNSLWKKGYLTKRHGKGNFLHKSAIEAKMRIDIYHDFPNLIASGGYAPSLEKSSYAIIEPSPKVREKLELTEKDQIVNFIWLYYADSQPAIYVDIQIPKKYFRKEPENMEENKLREYLSKNCQQDLAHCIANISAVSNKGIAEKFSLEPEQPLIMWEEYFFNIYDKNICYNEIFFNPQVMNLSLLIKI